jgi:hypothetical protein
MAAFNAWAKCGMPPELSPPGKKAKTSAQGEASSTATQQ